MNELNMRLNETNSKVAHVIPNVDKNSKNSEKFDTDFKKMEIKFADIEANLQSLVKLTTEHDTDIKDTKTKLKDFNILELLKAIGEDGNKTGENNNIILTLLDNLDKKYDTKMKVTDEKLIKLEESNFKMEKEIQNINNNQDVNKRNIDKNKKTELMSRSMSSVKSSQTVLQHLSVAPDVLCVTVTSPEIFLKDIFEFVR